MADEVDLVRLAASEAAFDEIEATEVLFERALVAIELLEDVLAAEVDLESPGSRFEGRW